MPENVVQLLRYDFMIICLAILPSYTLLHYIITEMLVPEIMNLLRSDLNKKVMTLRQNFCLNSIHTTHNMGDTLNDVLVFCK